MKFYVRHVSTQWLIGFCDSPKEAVDLFLCRYPLPIGAGVTVSQRGFAWPNDPDSEIYIVEDHGNAQRLEV
jgi:hypothetical protein